MCDDMTAVESQKRRRIEREKTLTHKNRPNACNRFGFIFLNSNDRGHETTDCWLLIDVCLVFGCVDSAHQFPTPCAPCKCWAHWTGGEDLSVSRRCFMLECLMLDIYCGNKFRCIGNQIGLARIKWVELRSNVHHLVGSWQLATIDNARHHTQIKVRAMGILHWNYMRLKHHSAGCCRWISTLWILRQQCFRLPLNARVAYIVMALYNGFAKIWWSEYKRRWRLAKSTIAHVRQCVVSDGRTMTMTRFPF